MDEEDVQWDKIQCKLLANPELTDEEKLKIYPLLVEKGISQAKGLVNGPLASSVLRMLLQEREAAEARQRSGAAAGTSGAAASTPDPSTIAARARCASRYRGYTLGDDGKPRTITVVTPNCVATFAHGSHDLYKENDDVQIYINNHADDKPRRVGARVKCKVPKLDIIIMEVQGVQMDAPPLDTGVFTGEPYIIMGFSTTGMSHRKKEGSFTPEDYASSGHGNIANTVPDSHDRIRGDTRSYDGDSGGGVFSLETGKLIAINVGREKESGKAVLVPIAAVLAFVD